MIKSSLLWVLLFITPSLQAVTLTGNGTGATEQQAQKAALSALSESISVDVRSVFSSNQNASGSFDANLQLQTISELPLLGVKYSCHHRSPEYKCQSLLDSQHAGSLYRSQINRLSKKINQSSNLLATIADDKRYELLSHALEDIEQYEKLSMIAQLLGVSKLPTISLNEAEIRSQLPDYDYIYPVALLGFVNKDLSQPQLSETITTLMFSQLSANPVITLVEREQLNSVINESKLNLSGLVNTNLANQVGKLTGAKIIISGTLFKLENRQMIVARIIGTETGRVLGVTVQGNINDSLFTLSEQLASKIAAQISAKARTLIARPHSRQDRVAKLKLKINKNTKPSLSIEIKEHHINHSAIGSAAENELMFYSMESGFKVIDNKSSSQSKKPADIIISGEGFTEFTSRKQGIVGVKSRLEIKAVDRKTRKVIATDRQIAIEVDLNENIAAKKALASASAKIAERLLPKLSGM